MYKNIKIFENVLEIISADIRAVLNNIPEKYKSEIEEIRLRNKKPLSVYGTGRDYFVKNNSDVSISQRGTLIIEENHIRNTFNLITNYSIYAFSEEIKNGFITVKGGHRVGIGGKVLYGNQGIENIINISSLNIRIAREKKGISDHIINNLIDNEGEFYNTMIISPPQCGKTTLLRDIIRNLSDGFNGIRGFKIGLVDERSEVAGIYRGVAQKDIGIRTDVLDACKKYQGIMMLVRAMSPEIIAVDEIGGIDDINSIDEALRTGVKFIVTVHGNSLDEISNRKNLKDILGDKVFKRYIILDKTMGVGTIKDILDEKGASIRNLKKVCLYENI